MKLRAFLEFRQRVLLILRDCALRALCIHGGFHLVLHDNDLAARHEPEVLHHMVLKCWF